MDKGLVTTKVVFDADGDVAGLFFMSAEASADWTPPPYADAAAFDEHAVTVGSSPALPGVVSLPKVRQGAASIPGVVLVHGSGPSDRDETLGAVKVFRDLAFGLASRQVAVLRYDKRSLVMPRGVVTAKRGYRPEEEAASLRCALLVMQGGRDYQVTTDDDFASWRTALRGAPNATLKWYASLDHRFVAGSGPSSPAQYDEPGHVDVAVIDDIAGWVKSIPPRP